MKCDFEFVNLHLPVKKQSKKIDVQAESELIENLRYRLETVLAIQAKQNIPHVYRDKSCKKENQFVHKYANGHKYLIQQDQCDSSEIILREF